MRTIKSFLFLLILVAIATLHAGSNAAPGNGPSASGSGQLTVGGELRTFAFTANTQKDGSIIGQAHLNNRASDPNQVFQVDIDCLKVVNNTAVVSGIVKVSHGPMDFTGWTGVFAVQDNGEGKNAPADRISLMGVFPPAAGTSCSLFTFANLPTAPIEGGNIQVKP
jgi:hypothetical protein